MRLSKILPLLLAFLIAPAWAQSTTSDRLEELEQDVEAREARVAEQQAEFDRLTREMDEMRTRSIEIANEVQLLEQRLIFAQSRVGALQDEENVLIADLDERRVALIDILAALQSMERNKPPAVMVRPDDAVDAARSAMLLGAVLPELEEQANALRDQLNALEVLRAEIETEQQQLAATGSALADEEATLDILMAEREALAEDMAEQVAAERRRLAEAAEEADDLRSLITRLDRRFSRVRPLLRPEPGQTPTPIEPVDEGPTPAQMAAARFASAAGNLRLPAVGTVLRAFGDTLEPGTHSQGVALATRPGARVVAPFDSEIVFAASYRGYGNLLILEPGDGYLILLAGLQRIDGVVGQQLLTGEPVGIMGDEILAPNVRRWAVTDETAQEGIPVLYLEMRENGAPVDPLPWFREDQWRRDGT